MHTSFEISLLQILEKLITQLFSQMNNFHKLSVAKQQLFVDLTHKCGNSAHSVHSVVLGRNMKTLLQSSSEPL